MMEGCLAVLYYAAFVLKFFLYLALVPAAIHKLKWNRGKTLAVSMIMAAIALFIPAFEWFPLYRIALESVLLLAAVYLLYHLEVRRSLFYISMYEIGVGLWEVVLSAGMGILFHSESFVEVNTPENLVSVWILRLLMIFTAVCLFRQKELHFRKIFHVVMGIVLGGFISIVTISGQSVIRMDEDFMTNWMILAVILPMYALVLNMNYQYEAETKIARLKTEQAELLARDYQTLNRAYGANAKLFHDFHNHLEILHHYLTKGKTEEAVRYLEELQTPIQELTRRVWTGDEGVDYLISSKLSLAEENHIRTKVNIEFPRNTNIKGADLSAILGNLLDNAVESCCRTMEQERFLNLTIRRIENMLVIKVENNYAETPVMENGELSSGKTDSGLHGWGIKSARTAAEKYDGTLEISFREHVFLAVAVLFYHAVERN